MATSWTDIGYSPSARVDPTVHVRAVHINELKTAIDNERARSDHGVQRAGAYSWSNLPVTAGSTFIRATHVAQLRDATYPTTCPTDFAVRPPVWTDPTLNAGSSLVRAVHINELRAYVNTMEAQCICNCNGYCANNCDQHCSDH